MGFHRSEIAVCCFVLLAVGVAGETSRIQKELPGIPIVLPTVQPQVQHRALPLARSPNATASNSTGNSTYTPITASPSPEPIPSCICPTTHECRWVDGTGSCKKKCNTTCESGFICFNNVCEPDADCTTDAQCGTNYICRNGKCIPNNNSTGGPDGITCSHPCGCDSDGNRLDTCCTAVDACCDSNGNAGTDCDPTPSPTPNPEDDDSLPPLPGPGPSGCPSPSCNMTQFTNQTWAEKWASIGITSNAPPQFDSDVVQFNDKPAGVVEYGFQATLDLTMPTSKRFSGLVQCATKKGFEKVVNQVKAAITTFAPGCRVVEAEYIFSCRSTIDIACDSTDGIFNVSAKSYIFQYALTLFRYQLAPAAGSVDPRSYSWYANTSNNAIDAYETNNEETDYWGYMPAFDATPYHQKLMAEGRVPQNSKRPNYYGSPGTAYIFDSGIDAYHPEFLDEVGASRVQNVKPLYKFYSDSHRRWFDPFHDQSAHGTFVAALLAGKTMGVAPKAHIVNFKISVLNLEDCANNTTPEVGRNGQKPVGYFLTTQNRYCPGGSQTVSKSGFISGINYAIKDSLARRAQGDGASVLSASTWPSLSNVADIAKCKGNGVGRHCLTDLVLAVRDVVSAGIIFVVPAGNEGKYIAGHTESSFMAATKSFAPWLWEVPDLIIVGGTTVFPEHPNDLAFGAWKWTGYDDTNYAGAWNDLDKIVLATNYGPVVDFSVPATGFPYWACTSRNRHRSTSRIPYYWHNNIYSSGTSFSAPQVAGGLLAYLSTRPNTTTAAEAIAVAKEWSVEYTLPVWDVSIEVTVDDPARPAMFAVETDLGYALGDWVNETTTINLFRLIPSENVNGPRDVAPWVNPNRNKVDYYHNTSIATDPYYAFSAQWGIWVP